VVPPNRRTWPVWKGDQDHIILVATDAGALARQDADDCKRHVANLYALADRGLPVRKQVLQDRLAQ